MAKTDYKLPQKLWFIQERRSSRPNDNENLGNSNLAYLTYLEFGKDGNVSNPTKKRLETGARWALNYSEYYNADDCLPYGLTFDNEPTVGFYIGDSVSRWTTQNKLFRVLDPRGFTIELSTGNIATLLHYTTVTNGYVQEPCVYCYEAGKHFLLPVNSELYSEVHQEIVDYQSAKASVISPKKLVAGQMYENLSGEFGYYLGCFNITWNIEIWRNGDRYSGYYGRNTPAKYSHTEVINDPKIHLCIPYRLSDGQFREGWPIITELTNPKFYRAVDSTIAHSLELVDIEQLLTTEHNKYKTFFPQPKRILKKMKNYKRHDDECKVTFSITRL